MNVNYFVHYKSTNKKNQIKIYLNIQKNILKTHEHLFDICTSYEEEMCGEGPTGNVHVGISSENVNFTQLVVGGRNTAVFTPSSARAS